MAKQHINRVMRPATAEEKRRHADIRSKVMDEFPPAPGAGRCPAPPGIPAQIRAAREARGLTWYALAKLADLPSPNIICNIETGQDVTLSRVQAVAPVLDLHHRFKTSKLTDSFQSVGFPVRSA